MKNKSAGKTISFYGQWQNKPESGERIYLFIFKDEATFLREQLATTQHFHNKIYVASC